MDDVRRDGRDGEGTEQDDLRLSYSDSTRIDSIRTSRLAVAACILAAVSLVLVPGLVYVCCAKEGPSAPARLAYQCVAWAVSVGAMLLGLIGLARIGLSAGRLTGRAFASIGVIAPVAQWLVFLALILLRGPTDVFIGATCSTNLSQIGKAMLIYANDYDDELPHAGGRSTQWTGYTPDWAAQSRQSAYGLAANGSGGQASITASLYLLVKYAELTPKTFICGGRMTAVYGGNKWARTRESHEEGITEFKADTYRVSNRPPELIQFWDFGPKPWLHCSYSYHMPYGPYALTTSAEPGFAVAADRNPWIDSPSAKARDFSQFRPDVAPFNGTAEQARNGNTPPHNLDGQNVLFLDSHVEFAKRAFCGLEDDNIYTISSGQTGGDPLGRPPKVGDQPANRRDSLLVNDPPVAGK